jgi:DNA polymerase-3 subunit delta'
MLSLLDIVGQDGAIWRLQQTLRANRMAHALLFLGPDGVGRRTTAVAMAQVLLCEAPQTRANAGRFKDLPEEFPLRLACGICAGCRMLSREAHPDLHVVRKELARYHEDRDVRERLMQEFSIDVIRRFLIQPASLTSARRRGKVFVVLEAELLSIAAQNALLKTLEEPPSGVTIILICRQSGELLPTTLSRCVTVNFRPLPRDFIRSGLLAEGVPEVQAAFWSAYADGSLGKAVRFARRGLYLTKREMVDRLAALPTEGDTDLAEYLRKVADDLAATLLAEAKEADGADLSKNLASRQAAGELLLMLASVYRDALTVATGAQRPLVHADQAEAVGSVARRFSATRLAEIIEQFSEYEQAIWRNASAGLVWDNAAITAACALPLELEA